ncbi:DUF6519 domain-containing protein [Georgenia subflava]|uniref:PASTA domain-containing protein n=1 Tax=Georgenia subflava TaxID=1622177 RepID=A0A6N7EQ23_9MICO|nr:DUF6519 domain-containing protein [Georgenia subflava]MPV37314.1 PASTA domain-containing protein [Georgenia subflava]
MHGDFTRWTHRPEDHNRSVLLQQGRVLLDADWNEQTAITAHHDETRTLDVVGRTGTRAPTDGSPGAFALVGPDGARPAGRPWAELFVVPGRYYVDGVLCESGDAPDPGWPLAGQPHLGTGEDGSTTLPEPEVPDGEERRHALYLDVFTHHVTADEEPALADPALGGPDTTTRARTVWQVRTAELDEQRCSDLRDPGWLRPQPPTMVAALEVKAGSDDPCQITAVQGYELLENQLYRVQVHDGGAAATFLWSRENGSVVARLLSITPPTASNPDAVLALDRLGRDDALSFHAGDVVELTSTAWQLGGRRGFLTSVTAPDGLDLAVAWPAGAPTLDDLGDHPLVRRWEGGPLPLQAEPQELEGGILVSFPVMGEPRTGDHWLVPARTVQVAWGVGAVSGTIEWPTLDDGSGAPLPPAGPVHHVAPLGILSGTGGAWTLDSDCRDLFPALTDLVSLDLVGGDGQEAMPGDPLPQPVRVVVRRGGLPVAGATVRWTAERGGIDPATPAADLEADVVTGPDGLATMRWRLGSAAGDPTTQTLRARLVDDHFDDVGASVVVTGRLSVAAQVQWDPACDRFGRTRTVQDALELIVTTPELRLLGGDGQTVPRRGALVPRPVRVVVDSACGPVTDVEVQVRAGEDGLIQPAAEDEPTPETLEGTGSREGSFRPGADGVVSLWWQPGFGDLRSAVVDLSLKEAAPVRVTAQIAAAGARRPGVHITGLALSTGAPFENDSDLTGADLATGIVVNLDAPVAQRSVQGKPVVRVELDLPWPHGPDGDIWAQQMVAFRTVELAAEWNADGPLIVWRPADLTRRWLMEQLWTMLAELGREPPLTGRFVLEGWAVVHEQDESQHVNTHADAVLVGPRTRLRLPTDDEVAGGTFVQWFRLSQQTQEDRLVVVPQVVGTPLDQARELLARTDLGVGRVRQQVAVGVPRGTVIAAEPTPGTRVPVGTAVNLTVAMTRIIPDDPFDPIDPGRPVPVDPVRPIRVPVPDVTRMTRARAERLLDEAGLVVELAEETSEEVRRNSVVGTDPPAGAEAEPGATVVLRVSTGRG